MLNLLFISDSPKAEYLKSALQPLLKVIIDVVTDFDHGLKEVFEKRPTTVCIQDQIGGVTGESVARHIQMLLGNSAPTFILLHNGDGKARTIKGLYEYLIDLSQSNEALAEDIRNTLKLLLGDQWERIYIPTKPTPAPVSSSVTGPEGAREDADKLVDDFLSDLETSGFSTVDDQSAFASTANKFAEESSAVTQPKTPLKVKKVSGTVKSDRAQAINDDLAELLLVERKPAGRDKSSAALSSASGNEPGSVPVDSPKPATAEVKLPPPAINGSPAATETYPGRTQLAKSASTAPGKKNTKSISAPVAAPPSAAAGFRISQNTPLAEEQIPEDLLLEFEESYRSESLFFRRTVVIALVCVVCAAGGWYLVKQKPQLINSLKQRLVSSPGSKQAPTVVPVKKPVPPPVPQPVMAPLLPAFIPKAGHDSSFAVKNPGWERYVGKLNEFRVFSASGRIQALQVLAVKDTTISDSLIKSILQEFAGSPGYQITSRSTKGGVRIESGRIDNKGEVMIYRKNRAVKAFVVSVH